MPYHLCTCISQRVIELKRNTSQQHVYKTWFREYLSEMQKQRIKSSMHWSSIIWFVLKQCGVECKECCYNVFKPHAVICTCSQNKQRTVIGKYINHKTVYTPSFSVLQIILTLKPLLKQNGNIPWPKCLFLWLWF